MNKKWIQQDIMEVKEQLDGILEQLNKDDNYDIVEFELDMQHVFSHLNVVYNTRKWTNEQIDHFSDADYKKVRKTPKDLIFID